MKKNIRKIPPAILKTVAALPGTTLVVGCAKKCSRQEIQDGALSHLGIGLNPGGLTLPPEIIPPKESGRYSDQNRNGVTIVRKDLPKERHYRSVEVPNWGDSYNGTHTVDLPYEAYPRDFIPPRELVIVMECHDKQAGLEDYAIAFKVDEVLDKTAKDFQKRLLENLNLLQENIGVCGVQQAHTSLNNYFKSLHVLWDILPPGNKGNVLQRLFPGKPPSKQAYDVASDRYDFFEKLKAKQLIVGSSGFRRYFGALLEDDLVVFENIQYGNAVYILFDNWKDLSQRSRIDLLSGKFGTDFERVTHSGEWKKIVTKIVTDKRKGN